MTPPSPAPNANGLLARLSEANHERLGEALWRLIANGSILGTEPGQRSYQWRIRTQEVEELTALLELKLFWDHEIRLVQAVPQIDAFALRLKLDATLVLLTLWYEFDTAVRDRGEAPPIRLNVEQLNDSLKTKFEPLRKHLPSPTRLREILSLAQRKNLLRFSPAEQPADATIDVLPTLKRVIPFQDIAEWNRQPNDISRHRLALTRRRITSQRRRRREPSHPPYAFARAELVWLPHSIPIDGNLLLAGVTGSGKSILMDLIQFVLVGDLRLVKFNQSATGAHSDRSLKGYCLGDTKQEEGGVTQYMRDSAVTYVALEFSGRPAEG